MKTVQRYERQDGFMIVGGAVTDADGFLRDSPVVARTGIYVYINPDGTTRREYRPPEEVFANDALDSFVGKPITVDHPKTGKVTSKEARKLAIGTILGPGYRKSEADVGCDIVIHTPEAIGERRELSLGYRVDLEEKAGTTPEGEPYDAIQHNIRVNHLAVVASARAGHRARLNLDGNEIIESEGLKMSKIKIDANEFEVDEAVASHIGVLTAKLAAAEAKNDAATTKLATAETQVATLKADAVTANQKLDAVTAERDALQAKCDTAEADKQKAVDEAVEKVKKEAEENAVLEDACKKAGIDKKDGMDSKTIKIAVIKKVRGDSFSEEGKSEVYIDAAFDLAMDDLNAAAAANRTNQQLHTFKARNTGDAIVCDADQARANMVKSLRRE